MLRRKAKRDDSYQVSAAAAGETPSANASSVTAGVGVERSATNTPPLYSSSPLPNTTTTPVPLSTPDSLHASSSSSSSRPQIPVRNVSSSNSTTAMPPSAPSIPNPSHNQLYYQQHGDTNNTSSTNMPSSSIGRSQSAFNFIISKAKASFSSSNTQQQQPQVQSTPMNTSTSMSSVNSSGSIPHEETVSRPRDVFTQGYSTGGRSSTSDRQPQQGPSRLNGEEGASYTSSPTKRGLFGGRERKVSVASTGKGNAALLGTSASSTSTDRSGWTPAPANASRAPFSQSPLGRGQRSDGPAISYSQFSKSHSDLHARGAGDFPSPVKKAVELPPMPTAPAKYIAKSKQNDHLQSPVNNLGFSRSVDDLVRDSSPDLRSKGSQNNTGTWGEVGLPQDNWGRASDIGTMANMRKDQMSPSGSFGQLGGGQVPFSSTPSYQASPSLRNTAWPQEPAMVSPSQHLAAPSSSSSLKKRPSTSPLASPQDSSQSIPTTKQLAPGVDFEGFLNRNANINLPLSQLSKGKEKDISKGWKPYKVLAREGKLFFYKPTGSVADEVKTLFPTGLIAAEQQSADVTINLDDISRGKLGTQELLAATSRGTKDQAPPPRLSSKRPQNDRLSAIADDQEEEAPVVPISRNRKWERRGKHEGLVLIELDEAPEKWWKRVQSGSVEALTHEYIFATQMAPSASGDEEETFLYSALVATFRAGCPVEQFVEEACKWTSVATSLSEDDECFVEQDFSTFRSRLEQRIHLLIESDIVNTTPKRLEMLAKLEELIAVTWKHDKIQAEAQLASVLAPEPSISSGEKYDHISDVGRSALRPSALLKMDPAEIARQIHRFTAKQYDCLRLPSSSVLRLLCRDKEDSLRLLSYDWSRPHFLTRLVLDQVLQFNGSLEGGLQHSAKLRASLLRHWIAVASFLLKLDNVAAWLAICTALCSRSIARLSSSWRFVASNDRALVANVWAAVLLDMGWTEVAEADLSLIRPFLSAASSIKSSMTSRQHNREDSYTTHTRLPFLGSALVKALPLNKSTKPDVDMCLRDSAPIALDVLELTKRWRKRDAGQLKPKEVGEPNIDIQRTLQDLYTRDCDTVEAFDPSSMLRLSLQLESPLLGKGDLQHKALLNKSLIACAQSPLVFPESLPSLTLLARDAVERLVVSSGTSIDKEQRSTDPRRSPTAILAAGAFPFEYDATLTNRNPGKRSSLNASTFARPRLTQSRKETPYSYNIDWASQGQQHSEDGSIRVSSDLLLCATSDSGSSSPSSPMMIKRFSQDMGVSSRPVSQVSKRSSLPASNRSSMIETPPVVLHTMVKAGTLDRLVDVLIMGVQHITLDASDDILDKTLGSSKRSRLSMDLESYRKAFLATYRSFCLPLGLLELLQQRFSAAVNASRELALPLQHRSSFPTWSTSESMNSQALPIDWEIVTRIRSGVITTLALWVARYPQEFAENDQLYQRMFLWTAELSKLPRLEQDDDWERSIEAMTEVRRQMQLDVMTCCIRQVEKRAVKRSSKRTSIKAGGLEAMSLTSTNADYSRQATIDFDKASPVELVEYLETVARVFFEKIEEKDYLMTSEMFQSRSNDPMAWFIAKNSSSALASQHPDEMPQVNNMYKLLELIRWPRDGPTLSQRLSTSIRDACAAQNLLRGWIAIHIIESRIGVVRRQARIEKLLDAVWICRARMMNSRGEDTMSSSWQPASAFKEPTIASFVECLIVGSLTSSESKLFTRAWQGVAARRHGSCDNLLSLCPPNGLAETYARDTTSVCTPDVGWILRTMAEAMTRSSIDSPSEGDALLVDFDRYDTIWTMIESSISYYSTRKDNAIDPDLVELAGARLTAMQIELRNVTWERKSFKEDAAYEANNASPLGVPQSSLMRGHRPLTETSTFQQDKHRRDRRALEVLEFVQHQKRSKKAAAAANANKVAAMAMANQTPQNRSYSSPPQTILNNVLAPIASASEKKTRRMTALFRGAVRPMNLMGSSNSDKVNSGVDPITHTVAELLSATPTQKPSLVVSCGSGQVKVWTNNQRSFVFHLSVVEGSHFVLQATSHREMQDWIALIEKASKDFALPVSSPDTSRKGGKKGPAAMPLYGSSLKLLVEHEKRPIPLGLLRMLEEVEARGLREQGIYRISGAKNAIEALKSTFDKQAPESVDLSHGEFSDIHTIAGAIKQWYRDLPEPAVPFAFYHRIINAEQISSEEDRLYAIRDLVWDFPKPHFELLRRTSQHLALVCEEGQHNLMAPHNIGLVFGTSLLNPPPGPSSVAESFGNIGKAAHIVKIIVTMHEWLFEPEPEAEAEAEAEVGPEEDADLGEDTVIYTQMLAMADSSGATPSSDVFGEQRDTATVLSAIDQDSNMARSLPASSSWQAGAMLRSASSDNTQRAIAQGGPRSAVTGRDRGGIESVYLDATEAIAALQDPFEEEDEGVEDLQEDAAVSRQY